MYYVTSKKIKQFKGYLISEEKSHATIDKYTRDVLSFKSWVGQRAITKNVMLEYKKYLSNHYAISSINSTLSALNSFFDFAEWNGVKVKTIKVQKQMFVSDETILTKAEYTRLLQVAQAKKKERLYLLMQCICSTGLRVSELKYITVDALHSGEAQIDNKGKRRTVFLPTKLCQMLSLYVAEQKISDGPVFVSKHGKPLDRLNIWASMKRLCKDANVPEEKVRPHNLRHLFARTYYSVQKDIVRLSDILGHSNINTTRIYTKENGSVHRQQIQKLGLLL